MNYKKHYPVIIIGSGPAGLTAAIYTARANLEPLLIEGIQPGGQLTITTEVENFPGFPEGIMGPELMDNMRQQAERFGTSFITDAVTSVDLSAKPIQVVVDKDTYTTDALIIATGASARLLGLESEVRLMGHGVSACATCDGFFFKGKEIIVVGGGDSACEEAVYLTKFASKVTLVHRRAELRASKIMQKRALEHPKIEMMWNSLPVEFVANEKGQLDGVKMKHGVSGETFYHKCDGAFIAIGHHPNTSLFVGQIPLNLSGYIITTPGTTHTSIEGVFACGDVQDHVYRQAISAAGSGCMAAIDAEHYLTEKGG